MDPFFLAVESQDNRILPYSAVMVQSLVPYGVRPVIPFY